MRFLAKSVVFSIILAATVLADDAPQVTSEVRPEEVLAPDVLTNEGVVILYNSGFSDAFIAEKIRLSRTRLNTTVEGLTYLRRNAVSEELIRYIMERMAPPPIAPAPAPNPAPAPAAALVPLKLARKKVLVPQTVVAVPISSGAVSLGMPIPMNGMVASYYGWYVPPAAPAYSVAPSPAFTAVGSPNGWMASR
jgi:hypothetical protein